MRHQGFFKIYCSFFKQSAMSQRHHRFVKIHWLLSSNLRRRSDITDSPKFIGHFATNLRRRRFVEIYWSFFDQFAVPSQILKNLLVIFRPFTQRRRIFVKIYWPFFDQSLTSLRRWRFVKIFWLFSNNLRQCYDITDSSKIYLSFFEQSATSRIRQTWSFFDQFRSDVADSSKFIAHFSSNMRRHSEVADSSKFNCQFSTNLRRRCDVTDFSKFIEHFSTHMRRRRIVKIYLSFSINMWHLGDVADLSKFIGYLRPICDVAATSEILQNLLIIFEQSATSRGHRRLVKKTQWILTNLRRRHDVRAIFDQSAMS